MRAPFVARTVHDATMALAEARVVVLTGALAVERDRLTHALGTIERLKLAGAVVDPEPAPVAVQDPVTAAILEKARAYPLRVRRQVMQMLGESARERLARDELPEEVAAHITRGVILDDGVPA